VVSVPYSWIHLLFCDLLKHLGTEYVIIVLKMYVVCITLVLHSSNVTKSCSSYLGTRMRNTSKTEFLWLEIFNYIVILIKSWRMRLQTGGMPEKTKEYMMLLLKTKQKCNQENDVSKLQTHLYVCLQLFLCVHILSLAIIL